jgi:hypothetical protein
VTPLLLAVAGLLVAGAGVLILVSFGARYRVGRLLAATPRVTIGDARRLAREPEPRYVRVDGRLDSEEDFEDAEHRPLVLRRTILQSRGRGIGSRWRAFETSLEVVPFVVREGLDEIAVDGHEVGDGLVVVRRESVGRVGDLGDRAPRELDDDLPARAVIEQVSSVEHATVLGLPLAEDGAIRLAPGLGRPLILTTLDQDEAMRVLAGGSTWRPRAAAACLVAGALLLAAAAAWLIGEWLVLLPVAHAASPEATFLAGADTRSSGQGPGLVGDPAMAVLVVLGIAALSILGSIAYVRLTDPRRRAARPPR